MSQQPIPGILPRWRDWSGPLLDSLFGLAPDGVFRAASLALRAVRSYRTFSPSLSEISNLKSQRAVCFLWHCPSETFNSARVYLCLATVIDRRYKVTRHRALWCSDFPPPAHAEGDSPPFQNHSNYKVTGDGWQVARKAQYEWEIPATCHGFTPLRPRPCRGCNTESDRS